MVNTHVISFCKLTSNFTFYKCYHRKFQQEVICIIFCRSIIYKHYLVVNIFRVFDNTLNAFADNFKCIIIDDND